MANTKTGRRTRPLRHERSDVLLFVTSRTVEERFWLHPLVTAGAKPRNRNDRRALVIRTPKCNCAAFVRDLRSVMAKHVNRVHGRSGPLWARRADTQPILDDESVAARVAYTIDNPRKANLVADPEQWPGLSLCLG